MGYGYGFPLFNFYPPLPYIIGQIFRFIGFSFVNVAKLTFATAIIGSGITMYYLAKEFFGRAGGVLSAAFYIWAPYHAVDIYVRGAMNEAWALVWFPLILWSVYRLIVLKQRNSNFAKQVVSNPWVLVLAVSYSFLFLSHNLMVMIFTPLFAGWALLHIWGKGNWRRTIQVLLSLAWSFGLSAFFMLPVLLERKFINIDKLAQGYLNYIAHFASLKQIFFSKFWGYGDSAWDVYDDAMSFQIGYLHWILSVLVGLTVLHSFTILYRSEKGSFHRFIKKVKSKTVLISTSYLLVVGWISTFMIHNKSTFIWMKVSSLRFVQFPWRFLAIVILCFSFVVGMIPYMISANKKSLPFRLFGKLGKTVTVVLIIIILVASNWNYFLPSGGRMGPVTDEEKFSGEAWKLQQKAGNSDYLPNTAKQVPISVPEELIEVLEGDAEIINEQKGTDWVRFNINIESDSAIARISIPLFPNWKVFIDGTEAEVFIPDDEQLGRMHVRISKGNHFVYAQLFDTQARTVGNMISVLAWFGLFVFGIRYVYLKHEKI